VTKLCVFPGVLNVAMGDRDLRCQAARWGAPPHICKTTHALKWQRGSQSTKSRAYEHVGREFKACL